MKVQSLNLSGLRVGIFEPYPDLATNPTLVALIRAIRQDGGEVCLFMPHHGRFPKPPKCDTLRGFPEKRQLLPWNRSFRDWRELWQRSRIHADFRSGIDLVIGVDPIGLTVAAEYSKRYAVPLVYLSFEIYFRDEFDPANNWLANLKSQEIEACGQLSFIVIQDDVRGKLLEKENGITNSNILYLPVAPQRFPQARRTDWLREHLRIPAEQSIVLHSGAFDEYTCGAELLNQVPSLPDWSCLVVHTRETPNAGNPLVKRAIGIDDRRFRFSTTPLPPDEYERMVASADFGVAGYRAADGRSDSFAFGKNLTHIGLASGKFSQYMKQGLPTITTQQSAFVSLLSSYGFGECVESFVELGAALERVRANYRFAAQEATRLFQERLCFEIHWSTLKAAIRTASQR